MLTRRRRLGFTLIELLVVIAIIAILAAVLFPVFTAARHKAKISVCQSHQKQLVSSLMLYVDDYAGRLPRVQFLSTGGGQLLCKPYVKNLNILVCPSMFVDPDQQPFSDANYPGFRIRNMGFAYNQHCLCDTYLVRSRVASSEVYETGRAFGSYEGRPLSSIYRYSRTPAFFCAESVHYIGDISTKRKDLLIFVGFGWEPSDARNPSRMVNAHNGGSDYAFLDGHVRWMPPAGNGFYQAIDGIDYDGNGTMGDSKIMR